MNKFEIQATAKRIFKDVDLYGIDVFLTALKKYTFVSWRDNCIPTQGSPTKKTEILQDETIKQVEKIIAHKDGSTTIVTNAGWLKFFCMIGLFFTLHSCVDKNKKAKSDMVTPTPTMYFYDHSY